jgi:hypothetical protein
MKSLLVTLNGLTDNMMIFLSWVVSNMGGGPSALQENNKSTMVKTLIDKGKVIIDS